MTPVIKFAKPLASGFGRASFGKHSIFKGVMRNSLFVGMPLSGLFRDLTRSVKLFVREELQLAKTEMSEKVSCYTHNATGAIIGGFVAYAGLIVLLGGLGILAGYAFQKMNLDPMLAYVIGLGA